MTFYVENETDDIFPFDAQETVRLVGEAVLKSENCPYETQVSIVLTNNEEIRTINKKCREIDSETDVLSFPNLDFEKAGVFEIPKEAKADYFDPDTGELILGDIMISVDKVREQAEIFCHSLKREFAFLVAHSMLHLCGYDHMESGEAEIMEKKQEAILTGLGITRD